MHFKKILPFFLIFFSHTQPIISYANTVNNPCTSPFSLISTVDRPTFAFSACTVPAGNAMFEAGYQYQKLVLDTGFAQNYPQLETRIGLTDFTEAVVLMPLVYQYTTEPTWGSTAVNVGFKHQIGYTDKLAYTVMGLLIPPSGSELLGSQGMGALALGIVTYTINTKFSIEFLFGVSTQTLSVAGGGTRFNAVIPDMVFTYAPSSTFNIYAEVYGQNKTAPNAGSGWNINGGFLFLLKPNIEIDVSVGQRLYGYLGGFENYIGSGFSILL